MYDFFVWAMFGSFQKNVIYPVNYCQNLHRHQLFTDTVSGYDVIR